jgi:hypothetical protein
VRVLEILKIHLFVLHRKKIPQVSPPGDRGLPVRSDRVLFDQKKTRCGPVPVVPPLENPRCGPVPGGPPPRKPPVWSVARWTPPVDRDREPGPYPVGFLDFLFLEKSVFFEKSEDTDFSTRVRMVVSDDDEERESVSGDGDGDGDGDGHLDEVIK